jgi:hypothetical protein
MQAASMEMGMSKLQLLHKVGSVTKELTSNPIQKNCTRKRLVERFYALADSIDTSYYCV